MMLQARVPAGSHAIVLHYWPNALTEGIVLAVVSAVFLVAILVVASWRRRGGRSPRRPDPIESATSAP
jgi:uncharacterized membrane protein YfhO